MKANVGDWLVMNSVTIGQPKQRGLITEVHSADGSRCRWRATNRARMSADE